MRNPSRPLADIMRPVSLDEIAGQTHLFGAKGIIRRRLDSGHIGNMIFYGPPGTGKTTAAGIIAGSSGMTLRRLNATTASLSDVKEVIAETGNIFGAGGLLLYLDEIQYFNRKQQQSLLEYIEDGRVTLIASTTENPYYYIYAALISRSSLYEFKPVSAKDIALRLERAWAYLNSEEKESKSASDFELLFLATRSGGDVRRALGFLEAAYYITEKELSHDTVKEVTAGLPGNFDREGDVHYDLLSALQKSIRGSDPNAALFYLARLLSGGDIISACRRLQVIASEDIGLAYPMAAQITRACCESAKELGLPEAAIPLSNCAVMLATAPKSNSANAGYEAAIADVEAGLGREIPKILKSPNFDGYIYPHDHKHHYIEQIYLPDDIKDRQYYTYGENKVEAAAKAYWEQIK